MDGKVKFKKKKFGGARRSRPVEEDDDMEATIGAVKSTVKKTKINKWAKYLSLGEETREKTDAEKAESQRKNQSNDNQGKGEYIKGDSGDISVDSIDIHSQLDVKSTPFVSLAEDDPMVVDIDAVTSVDSLGAYQKVANNTFSLASSHFRDSVPTMANEYDDLDEDPKPKAVNDDDVEMYDVDAYDEKPRNFDSDMYAFEIMSEASEETGVKIIPVKVASIGELILGLQREVEGLRASVLSSNGELERLKIQMEKAEARRREVVGGL